jgi:TonB family protein
LNTEQINLLSSTQLGTDIDIHITYQSKNSVTNHNEESRLNYSATIVPETEAEYPGGYQQLTQYIKEKVIDKISANGSEKLQQAVVDFTVNTEGEIADVRISRTSGNPKTDKLLLKVINNMPKWRPAEDSKGSKVDQKFEFTVWNSGC